MHAEEKSLLTDIQVLCSTFLLSQPGWHSKAAVRQPKALVWMELRDEVGLKGDLYILIPGQGAARQHF